MRLGYVAIHNLDTQSVSLFVGVCIQRGEQGSGLVSDESASFFFPSDRIGLRYRVGQDIHHRSSPKD